MKELWKLRRIRWACAIMSSLVGVWEKCNFELLGQCSMRGVWHSLKILFISRMKWLSILAREKSFNRYQPFCDSCVWKISAWSLLDGESYNDLKLLNLLWQSDLAYKADLALFQAISTNPNHILPNYLPSPKQHKYHLRARVHNFSLPFKDDRPGAYMETYINSLLTLLYIISLLYYT